VNADPEDVARVRADGDLLAFVRSLATPTKPAVPPPAEPEPEPPTYVIPRKGAWPVGTAASGPTPGCSCTDCHPAV
jgi:hypothetical protein